MDHFLILVALLAQTLACYAQQCTPGVPVPASCACGFNQCEVGEICDPNKNNGLCSLQCPAGQPSQYDCQCAETRCQPGELCDSSANNGQGVCSKLSVCSQGAAPVPVTCICGFNRCEVGEVCLSTTNNGVCALATQCPAGKAAQSDCQCAVARCQAGDRCDPNGADGQGACAKESQLSACPQGQLTAAYCLCGTEMCAAGLQCNNGKCEIPSGPISTCAAAPQLAPSSGCLCGSNICTQGQICDGYAKYCTPACSTTALVETPCHCGGSEICGWNQFCSTANGSPKCIKNYSSGCFKNVSQCSDPTFRYYCEASCVLHGA
ncbi:hypothetical protein AAVH_22540 [Aphelenchoides avenae]|nr:hypothetical protein AAVH_22540 [Aphelenchus avenae]